MTLTLGTSPRRLGGRRAGLTIFAASGPAAPAYGAAPGLMGSQGSTPVDLTGLATYYVDSVNGLNANNGTSAATPKQTIAALPTLVAGNTVALKCGSEFREALPFAASGTSAARITWGQYGTGTMPKVKGSKDYGTTLTWTGPGPVWSAPAAGLLTTSNVLYVDELTPLRKMASLAAITASGQYFPDTTNGVLYVRLPDDSSPVGKRIEQNGNQSTVANMGTRAYTTIQDIGIMHGHGNLSGILAAGTQQGVIVRRCLIGGHFGTGLYVGCPGMIAEDNTVTQCWDAAPYPSSNGNSVGINIGNGANGAGTIVRRNRIHKCYYAARFNTGLTATKFYQNLVTYPQLNGIDINGAAGTAGSIEVYNNTVIHHPSAAITAGHGLDQQGGDGLRSRNNLVWVDFSGTPTNVHALSLNTGTGANTSEDYNLAWIKPGSTAFFGKVGGTQYATRDAYVAAVTAAYGAGNNTVLINADPLFVDFAGGDYRLAVGSPARNAGTTIAGITDGHVGAAPDIGAYEMTT